MPVEVSAPLRGVTRHVQFQVTNNVTVTAIPEKDCSMKLQTKPSKALNGVRLLVHAAKPDELDTSGCLRTIARPAWLELAKLDQTIRSLTPDTSQDRKVKKHTYFHIVPNKTGGWKVRAKGIPLPPADQQSEAHPEWVEIRRTPSDPTEWEKVFAAARTEATLSFFTALHQQEWKLLAATTARNNARMELLVLGL